MQGAKFAQLYLAALVKSHLLDIYRVHRQNERSPFADQTLMEVALVFRMLATMHPIMRGSLKMIFHVRLLEAECLRPIFQYLAFELLRALQTLEYPVARVRSISFSLTRGCPLENLASLLGCFDEARLPFAVMLLCFPEPLATRTPALRMSR